MNRLVRIALTLFVSSTIMIFLINRRLARLPKLDPGETHPPGVADQVHAEILMSIAGMVITGIMLVAGLVLIAVAIARSRKKPAPHG